jgi:hypothetical protein
VKSFRAGNTTSKKRKKEKKKKDISSHPGTIYSKVKHKARDSFQARILDQLLFTLSHGAHPRQPVSLDV